MKAIWRSLPHVPADSTAHIGEDRDR